MERHGGFSNSNVNKEQSDIIIRNRTDVEITGVHSIATADTKEVFIRTDLGMLMIKGKDLSIISFNNRTVKIKAKIIDSVTYN